MNRADLLRLRPAILRVAAFALVGVAIAALGCRQAKLARDIHTRLLAEHRTVAARLTTVDRDAVDLAARAERYRQLDDRGQFGPERRLEWIEHIAAVRQARRLFDARYEFAAQRPLETPPVRGDVGVEFVASAMKLQMPLLHEGDLTAFVADLAQVVPALLRVRECRVERVSAEQRGEGPAPRLTASCRIDWITVRTSA